MSQFAYEVPTVNQEWLTLLRDFYRSCDLLTAHADFQTGSITEAAGLYLRTLCDQFKPDTVIEVGTFIGKSTHAMLMEPSIQHLFTCDMSNDCLADNKRLTCFPKQTSTQMFAQLVEGGVKADFFFFDGRLSPVDVALILRLSKWNTVYAFDDYEETPTDPKFTTGKGIANVELLEPFLREHVLIDPPERVGDLESGTTIAVLVPKEVI